METCIFAFVPLFCSLALFLKLVYLLMQTPKKLNENGMQVMIPVPSRAALLLDMLTSKE